MKNFNKTQKVTISIFVLAYVVASYYLSAIGLIFNYSGSISSSWQQASFSIPIMFIKSGYWLEFILIFFGIFFAGLIIITAFVFLERNSRKVKTMYGNAKFANLADMKKEGLFKKGDGGIIIGKYKGKFLRFFGQQFVSLGAPTRTGKGVSFVIPNLLDYSDSVVVLDVKGECYNISSKYRQDILKQKVYIFAPFPNQEGNVETHRYNPLLYLDFDHKKIEIDILTIGSSLFPDSKGDDFFTKSARDLFNSLIYLLGMFNKRKMLAEPFTLATVYQSLTFIKIKSAEGIKEIDIERAFEVANDFNLLSDTARTILMDFLQTCKTAEKQAEGIKGTLKTKLEPFSSKPLRASMATNDFDFRDLRTAKEKISIFVCISPDDMVIASPLLNLFFSQLIDINLKQGLESDHSVLLLMDEFTSMGYMQKYQTAIAYIAGYNLRSSIIYQNKSQLSEDKPIGYGVKGADTLLENHGCNIYFSVKSVSDAKELSEKIGKITEKTLSISHGRGGLSQSRGYTGVPLMSPEKILEMPNNEQIVLIGGMKIKCEKAFYFNDSYFIDKLKLVSTTLKKIKGLPSQKDFEEVFFIKKETAVLPPKLNF